MIKFHKGLSVSLFLILSSAIPCIANTSDIPENTSEASKQKSSLKVAATVTNATGRAQTLTSSGTIDPNNAFFRPFGTNGRTCGTCHDVKDNWSVTPASVRARFNATNGTDPIFRTNDGSNSPFADVSTVAARRVAYSMLLNKAVIRIGLPIPAGAEFSLVAVDDPYGFASASELSLFRRIIPSTNLRFLSTLMWDGRETLPGLAECIKNTTICFASMLTNLSRQVNDAKLGHAQATAPLPNARVQEVVNFELDLVTAQVFDNNAKDLIAKQARGGPDELAVEPTYFGINDTVDGDYRTLAPFNPVVFTLYSSWVNAPGGGTEAARRTVARGQTLFNTKSFDIKNVKGLNDDLGVASIRGTCTTCHNTPNAGNHSIPAPLDIGISDASRRTPDMPLYTLRRNGSSETIQTTDPGRALITGKWRDIGRFKGPTLRALSGRGPYFHNGSAATLLDVVSFYDQRFAIGLTAQEKSDLVAFMTAL